MSKPQTQYKVVRHPDHAPVVVRQSVRDDWQHTEIVAETRHDTQQGPHDVAPLVSAEFIARACNAHEALLALARAVLEQSRDPNSLVLQEQARQAVALAEQDVFLKPVAQASLNHAGDQP